VCDSNVNTISFHSFIVWFYVWAHNASALATVECAIELAGFGVALTTMPLNTVFFRLPSLLSAPWLFLRTVLFQTLIGLLMNAIVTAFQVMPYFSTWVWSLGQPPNNVPLLYLLFKLSTCWLRNGWDMVYTQQRYDDISIISSQIWIIQRSFR